MSTTWAICTLDMQDGHEVNVFTLITRHTNSSTRKV
jgi:hypothetical protein